MTRIKNRFSWLAAGLCLGSLAARGGAEDGIVADGEVAGWVAQRVAERQPSAEEKRFDEVGWVTDLRTAIRLGTEHRRPVFLFTMDGRINTGRC